MSQKPSLIQSTPFVPKALTSNTSFVSNGDWYPNPVAFADQNPTFFDPLRIRALTGQVHGDLHGYNILVSTAGPWEGEYYLIDLAFYDSDQTFSTTTPISS